MTLWTRWLSLRLFRAKARYWRRRALKAEKQLAGAKDQLEAEMWRNREREDTLITVPMRAQGLWGMPARDAPAPMKQINPRPLTAASDPWNTLSWADKQEFEMFWKPDAESAGIPIRQAQERFLAEVVLPRRMPLNDDPYSSN